jgi:hypothetical protein
MSVIYPPCLIRTVLYITQYLSCLSSYFCLSCSCLSSLFCEPFLSCIFCLFIHPYPVCSDLVCRVCLACTVVCLRSTQSFSRFSVTKWNNFIMKESFFSAKISVPQDKFHVSWCYLFLIDFDLQTCKRQTNAILNKIMDLFRNKIISFCQWKATIRLAAGPISPVCPVCPDAPVCPFCLIGLLGPVCQFWHVCLLCSIHPLCPVGLV